MLQPAVDTSTLLGEYMGSVIDQLYSAQSVRRRLTNLAVSRIFCLHSIVALECFCGLL